MPQRQRARTTKPAISQHAQLTSGMQVYISSFHSRHPIELGVAYWFRGHYLYSIAGLPIEPIPFATKKGVHIMGTTSETAPPFNFRGELGDTPEQEVAALQKSMSHMWEAQEQEKNQKEEQAELEQISFGAQNEEIQGLMSITDNSENKSKCRAK